MRRWLFATMLTAGCAWTNNGLQQQAVNEERSAQDDVDSWRGQPILEVETHPMFSTLPRQVADLSDGSQLWSFARCQRYEIPARCTAYPIGTVQFAQCTGGRVEQTCCIRQFRIADKVVQGFRALGPCVTGCQVRPGGCQARL